MVKKAGVIGYPIEHSFSPTIHNYWLKKYDIQGTYERIEVHPDNLINFLENYFQEYSGINVTIPYKVEVFNHFNNQEDKVFIPQKDSIEFYCYMMAKSSKSSNSVVNKDNNKVELMTTDGYGFQECLRNVEFNQNNDKNIIILGAGGACRAILEEFRKFPKLEKLYIANRTKSKAETVINNFFNELKLSNNYDVLNSLENKFHAISLSEVENKLQDVNLLVNTTSLGMTRQPNLDINISNINSNAKIIDIVFNPLKTQLILDAEKKGLKFSDGLNMLIGQAAPAFKEFYKTDFIPDIDEGVREHVIKQHNLK